MRNDDTAIARLPLSAPNIATDSRRSFKVSQRIHSWFKKAVIKKIIFLAKATRNCSKFYLDLDVDCVM